jgi:predicted N-acetyltransferase YhbS
MLELRMLSPSDDRARFRSGQPELDFFFHQFAGQNQFKHHIGTTYVAVDGGLVLGYVTVSPAHIERDHLDEAERKRLPLYPLPVLRVARLAVAESQQGGGVGRALLRLVFDLSIRMSSEFGCIGVLVDAKPEAERYYASCGFVRLDAVTGAALSQPVPMFIAINRLLLAAKGR